MRASLWLCPTTSTIKVKAPLWIKPPEDFFDDAFDDLVKELMHGEVTHPSQLVPHIN